MAYGLYRIFMVIFLAMKNTLLISLLLLCFCSWSSESIEIEDYVLKNSQCIQENEASKKKSPEESLQFLTKGYLSEDELVIRLIYSESLAANCSKDNDDAVVESIAWVLKNRLEFKRKIYGENYSEIVFKKFQFRSSFGRYDVAKRLQFLCPKNERGDLYIKARKIWTRIKYSSKNPIPNVRHYFLMEHFKDSSLKEKYYRGKDRGPLLPKWAVNPVFNPFFREENQSQCLLLFDVKE